MSEIPEPNERHLSAESFERCLGSRVRQLVPTGVHFLWLVSHQVTRVEAEKSRSLGGLISDIGESVGNGQARETFEGRLAETGWTKAFHRGVHHRWLMGTTPRSGSDRCRLPGAYSLSARRSRISSVRIPDVRYRFDLTGLEATNQVPEIIGSIGLAGDLP
jgi:hypothetical protein